MKLYHYCCSHSAVQIRRDGVLKPHPHPWLPVPLIHLTDLDSPDRDGLGLTSMTLQCDRTEFRVEVDAGPAERWVRWARSLTPELREAFESTPGALPMHWWVSDSPMPILSVRGTS